jgi:hypothetical protein
VVVAEIAPSIVAVPVLEDDDLVSDELSNAWHVAPLQGSLESGDDRGWFPVSRSRRRVL